jgi:hypothetical protein
MRRTDPSMIDVTTTDRGRRHAGIRVHVVRHLDSLDITVVEGIPATTVARTLLDLAAVARPDELAKAIHEAEYRRLFDLRAVEATIVCNQGHHGIGKLNAALAAYRPGGETDQEDDLAALAEEVGFEPPARNFGVDVGTRVVYPDLYWPARSLCLEADGGSHRTVRSFHEDRRRDRELFLVGKTTLRYTGDDLGAGRAATRRELAAVERHTRPAWLIRA